MLEKITPRERKEILVAWLALSIAFTLAVTLRPFDIWGGIDIPDFLYFFIISLFTVGVGFAVHEMAHKFTAIKYGFWAEFRKDNQMLLVAVALAALVGVVFAAPGATVIYAPSLTREQNGKISAAGPVSNLLLCIPFFLILVAGVMLGPFSMIGEFLMLLGTFGMMINAMFAFFNLLPVSILDGKKVLAWNPFAFGGLFVLSLVMLLLSYDYGGVLSGLLSLLL